jgi:hypothetical protein
MVKNNRYRRAAERDYLLLALHKQPQVKSLFRALGGRTGSTLFFTTRFKGPAA